ncbi:rho GTPase-activating protein 26-like [Diaphorina citri]|uniref:Rho GTPase-activating protein 26-like n=1 Tax=Diaphorina citri TaxID=121845 RepID=A0A3Q0IVE4_DIACI|nr:rho GTPase-activating protein 26-like [Diaphorina citri]
MEKKAFGTTWTKHYCMYQRDKKEFIMIPYNQMTGKFVSILSQFISCTVLLNLDYVNSLLF